MGKFKVVIDPGHGKYGNPYPPAKGYYEGTQMFKLAGYLKELLVKSGVDVVLTRNSVEEDPALDVRGKTAGKNGAQLFISLHSNAPASATDTGPSGVIAFYSIKDIPKNKPFATKLVTEVAKLMNTKNLGAATRVGSNGDWYGVIRNSAASGCNNAFLIEHGFHTNPTDVAKLIDDNWLKKIAATECELICEFLGTKSTASEKDVTTNPVNPSSKPNDRYALYSEVPIYSTAANAAARNKSLATCTYAPGDYYVYKVYNGMYNITKTAGTAGGWMNPADNIKASIPSSGDTISSAETFVVVTPIDKYTNAADAAAMMNAVPTKVAPGTYYIFKKYNDMYNISSKPNTAGAWVNPTQNVAKTCDIKVGDVVIVKSNVGTPIYGGTSYGTQVPISVIAKICTAKSYKVTKIVKSTHGFECYINEIGAYIMSDYLEVYNGTPVKPSTITKATVSNLSKELTAILKTEKFAPVFAAIKAGTISNVVLEVLESLLEDDSPIDVDTDLETIRGYTVLSATEITKFIKKFNPNFDDNIAKAFVKLGPIYGISGDIAICQSIVETGWFKYIGSAVKPAQHNYCGLGVTSNGVPGCSFATVEQGVEAQLQHLYAYACKEDVPKGRTLYDPRFRYVTRGCAPRWVDLDGKWCADGGNYGKTILGIYKQMIESA